MTEQLSIVGEVQSRSVASPAELKALRESSGLSVAGAAGQLRLAPRQVEALELGSWDQLPGKAFIKGALRSYGKLLSADIVALLASVDQQLAQTELKSDRRLDGKMPERSALGFGEGGAGSKWAWLILGVVGVAAIALYFGEGMDTLIPKKPSLPTAAQQAGTVAVPGQPKNNVATDRPASASGSAAEASAGSGSGAAPAPSAAAGSLARGEPGSASTNSTGAGTGGAGAAAGNPPRDSVPGSANPPGASTAATHAGAAPAVAADPGKPGTATLSETQFQISFGKESWVEIKDANGDRVLYGTQAAGTSQILKGRPPYLAVIGNSAFVKLEKRLAGSAPGTEETLAMPRAQAQGISRLKIE
jgi:cytoskeleton protein RodZ